VKPADHVEEQLPARLRERQIAEFVEDNEVEPRGMIGDPPLAAGARLGLQAVD